MAFALSLATLFGLGVGSFITMLVRRLSTGEPMVWDRSRCVHCLRQLRWFELLPALSFLLQGGQCRSCGGKIPGSYLAIELITAALFALIAFGVLTNFLPPPPFIAGGGGGATASASLAGFLYYAFFVAVAVAVSAYDLKERLIPRALTFLASLVGGAAHLGGAFASGSLSSLFLPAAVAAGSFFFFWALWFLSRGRAMGRGDADVALAAALILGPHRAILGLLFAFWTGAIFGIIALLLGRARWRSEIPFAPFLFGGSILSLLAAGSLLSLYGLAP